MRFVDLAWPFQGVTPVLLLFGSIRENNSGCYLEKQQEVCAVIWENTGCYF
jgi:hypothetical protein